MNLLFLTLVLSPILLTIVHTHMEVLFKPIGTLYFSDNEQIIKFEESLNPYYENVQMLQNNTMRLEKICSKNTKLPNCKYYQNELKEITEAAVKTARYVQLNKRNKRELLCFLISMLVVAVSTAIISFYAGVTMGANNNLEMIEQQNLNTNATSKFFEFGSENLHLHNLTARMKIEDQIILNNLTDFEYINHITMTSLLAADRHNRNTQKYQDILGNDLKEKFFSIIDIYKFNKTFHELKSDTFLSSLHPKDIITLSTLDADLFNDIITINIHIPALPKSKFFLNSIIPIPITRDHNNFILNFKEKYLLEYNKISAEISPFTLANCAQAANIVK